MPSDRISLSVPTHVTGFFSVHRAENSRATGSRGCGITLANRVDITVIDDQQGHTTLNETPLDVDAVEVVREQVATAVSVDASTDVPLGSGFGISGALALGTAFGANLLLNERRTANELIGIAHAADVTAGTGLGDVVAQAKGGIPIRIDPGGPAYGCVDAIPEHREIEYLSFGPLSTSAIIGGDTDYITQAGETALAEVRADPRIETFFSASRTFAEETGLLSDKLASVITAVESAGGVATMGMLGQTIIALDDGLSAAGYDATRCSIASCGVRIGVR